MIPFNEEHNKNNTSEQKIKEPVGISHCISPNNKKNKFFLSSIYHHHGVITTDCHGRIRTMNKPASEITGLKPEKAVGKPIDDILSVVNKKTHRDNNKKHPVCLKQHIVELINKKVIKAAVIDGCIRIKNGQEKEIEYSARPLVNENGTIAGTLFLLHNNTGQDNSNKNYNEHIKLNTLALLAGGIAHDYNNILTIISGNIAVAKTCDCIDNELLNIFTETELALKRAKDLTEKLRFLSKGSKPEKQHLAITELIKETTRLILIDSPITCSFSFETDLWSVEADEIQIQRVIQNIVLNARQHMDTRGTINIHVTNTMVNENDSMDVRAGPYIKITISDTGQGIPEGHLQKIFEPYFTTKPDTPGLGLTTAYAIIYRHKGTITVESREGKGTSFHIFLPAIARE